MLEALQDRLVLDRDTDAYNVLPDDAPAPTFKWLSIGVAPTSVTPYGRSVLRYVHTLGIAHEPIAETDGKTVCGQLAVRVVLPDRVHVRRGTGFDSVVFEAFLCGSTPTVVYTIASPSSVTTRLGK